jgi:hypothetical protein
MAGLLLLVTFCCTSVTLRELPKLDGEEMGSLTLVHLANFGYLHMAFFLLTFVTFHAGICNLTICRGTHLTSQDADRWLEGLLPRNQPCVVVLDTAKQLRVSWC